MSSVLPKHGPKPLQFDPSAIITRGQTDRHRRRPSSVFRGKNRFCVLLTQRASPLAPDSAHFRGAGTHHAFTDGCGGGKITRFTLGRTDNKGGVFPVWKLPVFYGIGIAY